MCEDTGFIHESLGVRRVWQERQQQTQAAAMTWRQRVTTGIGRMMQVGKAGNAVPEIGQHCLVLRGDEKKDVGQEAVVTKRTASRVHIVYRDGDGQQSTCMKHPALLMLLGKGLHVLQDAQGFVWVRREVGRT
jgi:hypothetical protein